MLIAPDSDIYLLKTPFEIDNINQLTFSSSTDQFNYFNSLPKLLMENATYQRKDNVLRYAGLFDDLIGYNYCMYRNNNFSDKWFYAYIKNINFVNPNMTELELETDVFQSWQFDIVYKRMFVEREHVNNDTIGTHTIPEGLETGEYINNNIIIDSELTDLCVILGCTETPIGTKTGGSVYGNVYSGLGYQKFFIDTTPQLENLRDFIHSFSEEGRNDALVSLFMCPKIIATNIWENVFHIGRSDYVTYDITYNKPSKIGNNYTPKNNKLFTFPYTYLMVNNNNGVVKNYSYEMFSNNTLTFKVRGLPTPGCSIKLIPENYKGISLNHNEGISGGKFPSCSWASDEYTNWLTQNAVNANLGIMGSIVGGATGGATLGIPGVVGGAIVGGATGIFSHLMERYQKSFTPDSANGNINLGDINTGDNTNSFIFTNVTIKNEYAKIIDDYFSMYGYKVNSVKVPNITGRRNWNYVKTINCNILGEIPQQDLQKIKTIFDNGVTLWHNPNTFLDYSQNNNII